MTIRPAQTDEGSVIVSVLRQSCATVVAQFGLTEQNCPKNPAFYTEQRYAEDLDRGVQYYLLEDEGQVCGCVALERAKPEAVYLERLAVLPEHRCKGFGQALVHHIFVEARQIGVRRVEIGIIKEDTRLKDWYRRLGFVPTVTKTFDHLPFVVGFLAKELE